MKVSLPVGAAIAVDNAGIPTAQSVFLSGQFAGAALLPQNFLYDAGLRLLKVSYASASSYQLGEFITISVIVPKSYIFNAGDFVQPVFDAFAPSTGVPMPYVTATASFP
ncbi:MAG: hypothetical protein PHI31_16085 [Desulfuromonadaceae bacterium]|nr:hypothetical protein [Desulfuromonadaceae bacterium]